MRPSTHTHKSKGEGTPGFPARGSSIQNMASVRKYMKCVCEFLNLLAPAFELFWSTLKIV